MAPLHTVSRQEVRKHSPCNAEEAADATLKRPKGEFFDLVASDCGLAFLNFFSHFNLKFRSLISKPDINVFLQQDVH